VKPSKSCDVIDPAIKYGGGDKDVRSGLTELHLLIAEEEKLETQFEDEKIRFANIQARLESQEKF
jgi:hypothetical protein